MANGGVRVSPKRIDWDISGRCQAPVGRDLTLKAGVEQRRIVGMTSWVNYKKQSGVVHTTRPPRSKVLPLGFTVSLTVKCRQCEVCRKHRAMEWAIRAKRETMASPRTWFCTFTLHPDEQYRLLCRARARQNRQGIDYDRLPIAEQFRLRVTAAAPLITLYLKRVRKESGALLRYLWVSEAHKSGHPHFHALIHEVSPDSVVTHACLTRQWPHGFTQVKLVREIDKATYLTKYLSKESASRVRSSLDYGQPTSVIAPNMILEREKTDPQKNLPSLPATEQSFIGSINGDY